MIQVESLSKSFGKLAAVQNLSFQIGDGEVVSLLGPNGAGKTTTMRILAGYFPPSSGSVRVNGANLFRSPKILRRQIGYVPERSPLYPDMTTRDFLYWVAELKGVDRHVIRKTVAETSDLCGLGEVQERPIGKLSKGFQQRICFAQALLGNPKFLILDEPTSGLDPKQVIEIRSLIKTLGRDRSVILSTHILPEASSVSDRVLIIHEGRLIASGSAEELSNQLRHTGELTMRVRGNADTLESDFKRLKAILAIRLEESNRSEHVYRIVYKKDTDLRPLIAKQAIESGLELLELQRSPMSLEDIFLKLVVREDGMEEGA